MMSLGGYLIFGYLGSYAEDPIGCEQKWFKTGMSLWMYINKYKYKYIYIYIERERGG